MNIKKLIIRIVCYVAVILFVLCLFIQSGYTMKDLNPTTIEHLANHHIPLMLLIMFGIMLCQNIFTFIPLVVVIGVNTTLFGFWQGYAYSIICSTIASTLIFLSIRFLFPNLFAHSKLEKYEKKIEKNGFLFVLSGRILPFMPTNLINILSGISSMKISSFILGTAIGNTVYGFVLAAASFGVISLGIHDSKLLVIMALFLLFAFVVFKSIKKRTRSQP
ncbi:TVP38/TMEM64 family protein [Kurthia senegalensis]|uniref:TVP38/TMEM64 family protein n=1 Tax=Kurthia senegalensis TaxID=1033740 RepID=UPI0002887265|nr:VTT domain-containing protein [Kurthia senegalensis]